ncbi:hypothetical protein D3C85_784450 [compost metagenome]
MDQCKVALFVVVHEFLLAQPFEQFSAIGRFNDLAQGVGLLQAFDIASGRQQVQVMVAEHAHQRFANAVEEAQGFQRLRAAVDQVAHQPQTIPLWVERHLFEQALQGLKTALQVTDSVRCHQCRAPGTARRKGAMMASKCLPSSDSI